MRYWSIAARVAQQQHLVLAPWQLTALGLCHETIREHVQRHGWSRDSRGALWLPGDDTPIRHVAAAYLALSKPAAAWRRVRVDNWDDEERVADALVTAARGSGVVVCGPTAAWLHNLSDRPGDDVWVLLDAHAGRVHRTGVRLRYGAVAADMVTIMDGIPLLNIEHAVIDMARVPRPSPRHTYYALVHLIRRGERQRQTNRRKVRAAMDAAGKFRGKPVLREVLDDLDQEFTHSNPEAVARDLVRPVVAEFGLELHPEPLAISQDGVIVAEADLPVPAIKYDIEVDGPDHDEPEQREKDRLRDRNAAAAEWYVERFPAELIELSPRTFQAQVRQTIRRLLRQQGHTPS